MNGIQVCKRRKQVNGNLSIKSSCNGNITVTSNYNEALEAMRWHHKARDAMKTLHQFMEYTDFLLASLGCSGISRLKAGRSFEQRLFIVGYLFADAGFWIGLSFRRRAGQVIGRPASESTSLSQPFWFKLASVGSPVPQRPSTSALRPFIRSGVLETPSIHHWLIAAVPVPMQGRTVVSSR